MRRIKKTSRSLTVDEFLHYIPKRGDFQWNKTSSGLVEIIVPKFERNIGKSFCNLLKKNHHFIANLDAIGSFVWRHCDGTRTVNDILQLLKQQFPNEEHIDQRFFLFLQQMKTLHYISFELLSR